MRLLNVNTLDLEEFMGEFGYGIPPYAILSHAWGKQEVSFSEMTADLAALAQREGYQKIVRFCAKAKSEGHCYAWIDTCCIDKSSSAELSEAINSMFRWYREATVCYAYLDDVRSSENPADKLSSFPHSRWFTRGWTLQELLAPHEVVFLSKDWREIGTKRSLRKTISSLTTIDEKTLVDCTWDHASVACKMSWASSRNTTRLEDKAYCLMGLFDVNMPIIYGEGHKAFYRLQLEIMKSSEDQSIFAWAGEDYRSNSHGLLAESPHDFKLSYDIVNCKMTTRATISYESCKQYIRLSTIMLQPFEKQEVDGNERLRLNPDFTTSDLAGKDIMPDFSLQRKSFWDSIVIAVLRCKDELGYIAIPLRRLRTGNFERFAGPGLRWLRTHTKQWRPLEAILITALRAQNMNTTLLPSRFGEIRSKLLIHSLFIEGSGYYISGGYPPNFIAAPGEIPTHLDALTRINKAIRNVTTTIVFFAHDLPTEHLPFAIRFDRSNSYSSCYIRCRVGPSIKDWERGKLPASLQDDKVVVSDEQIPLSENLSLFIRPRRTPLQSQIPDFVNISIENNLPWQKQIGNESIAFAT
jgi:hypothetical protein